MRILGIETSCDETALCTLQAEGDFNDAKLKVESSSLLSQINLHREFGGVYPNVAKREHAINLTPTLQKVLKETDIYDKAFQTKLSGEQKSELEEIFRKEPNLADMLTPLLDSIEKPSIDRIAVTVGPGLEPALWVGINFAKALSSVWDIPVIPVNHMEGHVFSALLKETAEGEKSEHTLKQVEFPALALLISGGHTELVLMRDWLEYEKIGQTRDDAIGEAFDKVARMLELPYPGGPEISKLAQRTREENLKAEDIDLPRPMIDSGDWDFSFSGIKTAVMYKLKEVEEVDEKTKKKIALDFENSVTEVIVKKTKDAIEKYEAKTLLTGGGVSANKHIRASLKEMTEQEDIPLNLPLLHLSIDNAVMIATAGYFRESQATQNPEEINASGQLPL